MNATLCVDECDERIFGAGRVFASFFLATFIGGSLLGLWMGPLALLLPFGALVLGFPALVVAIAIRAIFDRSIRSHLLVWSFAGPFIATATSVLFWWAVDYRQRGFGIVDHLSLQVVRSHAMLGFFFAAIASIVFFAWERRSRRRG